MNFFKKTLLILFISAGILGPIFVFADAYGLETAGKEAGLAQLNISTKTIPGLAGEIIGVGLSLVGIIFFLLMLYAGIRWMIAMGKSEDVQKAKDTLEAAAIGLVIVLSAYAITQFVFSNLGVGAGGGGSPTAGGNQPQACVINDECANGNCVNGFCGGDPNVLSGGDCADCCYAECKKEGEAGLLAQNEVDICARECQACNGGIKRWPDAFNSCTLKCSEQRNAGESSDCGGGAIKIWCFMEDDNACIEGAPGTGCPREFPTEGACKAKQTVWCSENGCHQARGDSGCQPIYGSERECLRAVLQASHDACVARGDPDEICD